MRTDVGKDRQTSGCMGPFPRHLEWARAQSSLERSKLAGRNGSLGLVDIHPTTTSASTSGATTELYWSRPPILQAYDYIKIIIYCPMFEGYNICPKIRHPGVLE